MNRPAGAPLASAAPPGPQASGLLAVDKPAGLTSHDVVARVRRALNTPGAGHLGTLDPPATGLLLVAVGAATRCASLWQGGEKTYEATIRFGLETDTEDLTGRVVAEREVAFGEAEVRAATPAFVGDLLQVPPMVSAIHVRGKRLHELARAGITVTRAPRPVRVLEWTWLEWALPEARARIRCSGGTYVRSLARDLGRALGCGAVLATLRRVRSEPFGLERSVGLEELSTLSPEAIWERGGIPLGEALAGRESVKVEPDEHAALGHGHALRRPAVAVESASGEAPPLEWPAAAIVLRDSDGVPLAIAERVADPRDPRCFLVQPRIVFPWTVNEGAA